MKYLIFIKSNTVFHEIWYNFHEFLNNLYEIWFNFYEFWYNFYQIWYNFHKIWYNFHKILYNFHEIWYNFHEIWYSFHQIWYNFHEIWYNFHEIWYNFHQIWYDFPKLQTFWNKDRTRELQKMGLKPTKSKTKNTEKSVLKINTVPKTPKLTHAATLKHPSFQPAPAQAKLTDYSRPRNKNSEFLHSSKS